MLMARVAQSISGSQRGLLGSAKEERGTLKWYSLIDRGARDSVCERNSKKSPRDDMGGGGGAWWEEGSESEGGWSMVEWRHRARKLHCVHCD